MQIFSDEFVAELRERYEKSGIRAPPLYRFATVDEFAHLRETMQGWFDQLSLNSQAVIIRKMRTPKSFFHTYNELRIAGFLLRRYSSIEYEENLGKLTPDWTVKNEAGEILFVVEVLTKENSAQEKSLSQRMDDLREKIGNIKIPVGLYLSYGDEFDEKLLDSKQIKSIVFQLRKWLENIPPLGATISIANLDIELIRRNPNYTCVQMMGPSKAFWVDSSPLKKSMEEKISRYADVSEKLNVPFVLAVVPNFDTAITGDTLVDLLFGSEVFRIQNDLTASPIPRKGGLFSTRKLLSAVITCMDGEYDVFHNPMAVRKAELLL